MIEVENLSKRYGEKLAVDGLDFVVGPGVVTGFLGPNGAGQPVTTPGRTTKSSPATASFSPYRLLRFSTSIIAWSLHR